VGAGVGFGLGVGSVGPGFGFVGSGFGFGFCVVISNAIAHEMPLVTQRGVITVEQEEESRNGQFDASTTTETLRDSVNHIPSRAITQSLSLASFWIALASRAGSDYATTTRRD
jgi:hypothetical protein